MRGLEACTALEELYLSHNGIEQLEVRGPGDRAVLLLLLLLLLPANVLHRHPAAAAAGSCTGQSFRCCRSTGLRGLRLQQQEYLLQDSNGATKTGNWCA
jgi:hypothetical protein